MNTLARIATVCSNRRVAPTPEENREYGLQQLRDALSTKPDLVCLPETFTSPYSAPPDKISETVPGPTVDAAAGLARQGRCYVICPILTKRDGKFWNSAVLIGRDGQVVGTYDKRSPVTSTHDYTLMEDGLMPGATDGVFDLDFGRIGVRICFDIGYPKDWSLLADRGVRLVVWSSAYNGGMPLQAYASLHEYYVVSAVRQDSSRIIDPCGMILARTDATNPMIYRDINLDYIVCHTDFNYGVPARIERAYGKRVNLRCYDDEGELVIEPMDASITTEMLKKEFGIETRKQYLGRHQTAYGQLHAGKAPVAQVALHGKRPMYSAE